jgi:hypothetical protein
MQRNCCEGNAKQKEKDIGEKRYEEEERCRELVEERYRIAKEKRMGR